MDIFELIRHRRSVRTFDGKGITPEEGKKILEFAEKLENPYDIPIIWKILDGKKQALTSPVIVGTDTYIAGKLRQVPHAEEAFGYAFEKLVLFAESLGLGTTWIAGTMNRPAFEKAMGVTEGEKMPCVSPLGHPADKMSLRETMMRKGVKADSRMSFSELFYDGSFEKPLSEAQAGRLKDVLASVHRAPSAVNKQPWRLVIAGDAVYFYEEQSKGYVSENGWDLQKIDLGIALCHFEMAAAAKGISAAFELADPGIPAGENRKYIASYNLR